MTLQFKQAPLLLILLAPMLGVVLWQQPRNSGKSTSRTVPNSPKPRPNEPMARAKPATSTPTGTAYGTEEIILNMNKEAREAGQQAYEATMAGFKPRDTRPLSERAKDLPKGWRPPVLSHS